MLRYAIVDRSHGGISELLAASAIDFMQLRDKALTARELLAWTRNVLELPNPGHARILVNTRLDVALAVNAHGVHLPSDAPAPRALRPLVPPGFLIGVSCHSTDEVRRAESEGADYVLFGPVFPPLSKADSRPSHGIAGLREAVTAVKIPVFALGGITPQHVAECRDAGAAGVAGITLFR